MTRRRGLDRPLLFIIDSFIELESLCGVKDENNPIEMANTLRPLHETANATGTTIVVIHHFRKLGDALKSSGRVAIIDFTPEAAMGPPKAARVAAVAALLHGVSSGQGASAASFCIAWVISSSDTRAFAAYSGMARSIHPSGEAPSAVVS